MAHKKAGGSTALGRDSVSKRLGVKIFGDVGQRHGPADTAFERVESRDHDEGTILVAALKPATPRCE